MTIVTDCRWPSQGLLSIPRPDGGIKNPLCIQDVPRIRAGKHLSYLYGNILIQVNIQNKIFSHVSFQPLDPYTEERICMGNVTRFHNNGHLLLSTAAKFH